MNSSDLLELIKNRRSIRQFESRPVPRQVLDTILEAGLYAPSAGSRQSAIFLPLTDADVLLTLGQINRQAMHIAKASNVNAAQPSILDQPQLASSFYGAPCAIAILAPKGFKYGKEDAACAAQNMLLMASALGMGGCIVARADQTMESELGKQILHQRGVPEGYEGMLFVLLGYPKGQTLCKERKARIF